MFKLIKFKFSFSWKIAILLVSVICLIYVLLFWKNVAKQIQLDHFTLKIDTDAYDTIDVVYYINLDHRTDRNAEFLEEMNKIDFPSDKIVRIPAVYLPKQGDLGCSMSHIKTLDEFIQSSHQNCIIFEDDFEFIQNKEDIQTAFSNLAKNKVSYDVCMLSANVRETGLTNTTYPFIKKVENAQTASGYMVSKSFAPTLLQNYKEGAQLLQSGYDNGSPDGPNHCIDQYWKRLQPSSNWYLFYEKLGKQRKSHSDIQGGVIDFISSVLLHKPVSSIYN